MIQCSNLEKYEKENTYILEEVFRYGSETNTAKEAEYTCQGNKNGSIHLPSSKSIWISRNRGVYCLLHVLLHTEGTWVKPHCMQFKNPFFSFLFSSWFLLDNQTIQIHKSFYIIWHKKLSYKPLGHQYGLQMPFK